MQKKTLKVGVILTIGLMIYCGKYWASELLQTKDDTDPPMDYEEMAKQENENVSHFIIENEETNATAEVKKEKQQERVEKKQLMDGIKKQVKIDRNKLKDYDYLCEKFYQIDSSTSISSKQLDAEKFLKMDMSLDMSGKGPQILIYHTHSQEEYKGKGTRKENSVVAVGDYLTELLEKRGFSVMHHKGEYDVGDRDHAYSRALPKIQKILKDNPSIQLVIDLHRDGISDDIHLVTDINGKKTAKIMFFNGLSYTNSMGNIDYLSNPYKENNLALSFLLHLAAEEYYPGLTRKIYLKGYRYNMHLCSKSILVEVGAQTNTTEEAKNAMVPLANILTKVLK